MVSTPMTLSTLAKAASVLALIHQVSGACYRPDGVDRNSLPWVKDNDYQPCNKGGGHSMCCSTVFSDTCRPNGLCYNSGAKLLWRESCTDPTWKDPACLKLCVGADQLTEEGKSMATIDSVITICGDNSLCCGDGDFAQRCCDAKKGYKILGDGTVVEAYPEPKTTAAAPKPTTAAQKNGPPPTPTPRPADPSPNTGSGGGGSSGGGNNNNGGNGGGSTNNGDGSSGSNSGGSGGSGGGTDSGNDNNNDNGSGSPALSAGGAESTTDPKSGGPDGTKSNDGGKSSTPNDSQTGDGNDSNGDNDGPSDGNGTGNKDSKDSSSSPDEKENNAGSGGSSSGDTRSGNSPNDNSNGGSGTAPSGGSGSSGALIGGVVGGVLGGLILFALAAWFAVRRRRAMRGGYAARRLGSASELPGTEGRTFYEVSGDHKPPPMPVVEQVAYAQDKVNEPSTYHEMEARNPVLAPPARYS